MFRPLGQKTICFDLRIIFIIHVAIFDPLFSFLDFILPHSVLSTRYSLLVSLYSLLSSLNTVFTSFCILLTAHCLRYALCASAVIFLKKYLCPSA